MGNIKAGPSVPLLHMWARRELKAGGPQARRTARKLLKQALDLDPNHLPSIQTMASLADRCGDRESAEEMYGRAMQYIPIQADASSSSSSSFSSSGGGEGGPLMPWKGMKLGSTAAGSSQKGSTHSQSSLPPKGLLPLLHSRLQQLLRHRDQVEMPWGHLTKTTNSIFLTLYSKPLNAAQLMHPFS